MPFLANEAQQVITSVNQAFDELATVAKSLNTDAYLNCLDKDNFTALNPDGSVTHSFEDFATTYRQQIAFCRQYNSLVFDNVKITPINATTAILVNQFTAEVVLESGDVVISKGAGTQVWTLSNDLWKLVSISSSIKS